LQRVVEKGHSVGNHTFNHLKGWKTSDSVYFDNIKKASDLIPGNLFRPPHGQITPNQAKLLISDYQIVMWSVLTEDYNANLSSEEVFKNVATHVKSGSIIVFHDSLKASKNMIPGLRLSIPYLIERGYRFEVLKSHSTLIAQ
jgi:peptidoglycan/xylan/chitin deacetylase (PgdA/CDA1 family)